MQSKLHVRLREWRIRAGYKSQKSFLAGAERMGYGRILYHRYSAIERGELDPGIQELKIICRTLGVSADALLFEQVDPLIVVSGLTPRSRRIILRIVEMIKELERP